MPKKLKKLPSADQAAGPSNDASHETKKSRPAAPGGAKAAKAAKMTPQPSPSKRDDQPKSAGHTKASRKSDAPSGNEPPPKKARRTDPHPEPPAETAAPEPNPKAAKAARTIFLRNLPKERTKEDITGHYACLGPKAVSTVRWHKTPHVAEVRFTEPIFAAKALRLPGPIINGVASHPEPFGFPADSTSLAEPKPKATPSEPPKELSEYTYRMFIGKCPDSITDAHIRAYYSSLGDDAIMKITWIRPNGQFKGYGFVSFRDKTALTTALAMPPPEIEGRRLTIQPSGVKASTFQLFVGGYGESGKTIVDARKYYEKFLGKGCITRSRELTRKDGSPQGAGFLDFSTKELMEKAYAAPPPVFGQYALNVQRPGEAPPPQPSGSPSWRQLRILHCPPSLTEDDLRQHYAPLGPHALHHIDWTKNRQIAFVVFNTVGQLKKALELGPPVVDFHILEVVPPDPPAAKEKK